MVLVQRRRNFFVFTVVERITKEWEGQSIFPPPVAVRKRIFRSERGGKKKKKKRFCVGPAVEVGLRRRD